MCGISICRSKSRLLQELPIRLRGYRQQIEGGEDIRIAVLVDRDRDDCTQLKARLEGMARDAGLLTKSSRRGDARFVVVNRIAIEELEAWFMGDQEALAKAFTSLRGKPFPKSFAYPDSNGTWEQLYQFLKKQGVYRRSYPKIEAARTIAKHMEPGRNNSKSFRQFVAGVEALVGDEC